MAESIPPAHASDMLIDNAAGGDASSKVEKRPEEPQRPAAASGEPSPAAKSADVVLAEAANASTLEAGAGASGNHSTEGEDELTYTTFEFTNGSYKGQVNKRKDAHGFGKFTSKIGAYEGQWQDGKHHGEGQQTWSDGRIYVGQFVAGQFGGKGKMTWHKGEEQITFEGDYIADKKHGQGKMVWPSGEIYDGEWVRGKRHGQAKVKTPSPGGVEREEIWENDACVPQFAQSK